MYYTPCIHMNFCAQISKITFPSVFLFHSKTSRLFFYKKYQKKLTIMQLGFINFLGGLPVVSFHDMNTVQLVGVYCRSTGGSLKAGSLLARKPGKKEFIFGLLGEGLVAFTLEASQGSVGMDSDCESGFGYSASLLWKCLQH